MLSTLLFVFASIGYVSAMHASCDMTLTVKSVTISALNSSLVKMVESRQGYDASSCVYASLGNEFCGYSVKSVSPSLDHFQHETPTHHYVDDVKFSEWKQKGNDVVVDAYSKSEPNSYYDYDGNVTKLNYDLNIDFGGCTFHPSTSNAYEAAFKQCNTY